MTARRIPGLGLALLLASGAAAQTPASFTGTWEGPFNHEGRIEHMTFVLAQHDSLVAGESYRGAEEFGAVTDGRVSGDTVWFTILQLPVEGVLEGDRMRVTLTVYNGTRYRFIMVRRSTESPHGI
jgi:hypothetical protein